MAGGRERRAASAAAAAAAEDDLRRGWKAVMRLKEKGDMAKASARALKLVDLHPRSAIPYNLVGLVMEAAAAKLRERIEEFDEAGDVSTMEEERRHKRATERAAAISELSNYLQACALWYCKAAERAPRCVFTRSRYASSLGQADRDAEAHQAFKAAIQIHNAEIPTIHNPWLVEQDSDEEAKRLAMAKAGDEFRSFLHQADRRVYTACKELLISLCSSEVQGTPGLRVKNEAVELANRYPFSARASLLSHYLTRKLIESSSSSSSSKIKRYQNLLREIADVVDLFPSSIVVSLFRAEVLFSMRRYLEASLECLRAMKIKRPDDPMSQDVPPGWASGSGRSARTAAALAGIMDLLEQAEEEMADANDIEKLLRALSLDSGNAPAANNRGKRLVKNLNMKLLQHSSRKNGEPRPTE